MGVVCVVDLIQRTTDYGSAQHTPAVVLVLVLVPTLTALTLATLGGERGGWVVYRAGIGVHSQARPNARPGDARAIVSAELTGDPRPPR
jgi:hypothetical protein